MKNKCAKILVMLILSVITINYIGSTVLAVEFSDEIGQELGITKSVMIADVNDTQSGKTADGKNKTENPGDKVGDKSAKDKENELMEKAGDSAISSAMGTIADGIVGVFTLWLRIQVLAIATGLRLLATAVAYSAGSATDNATLVTPDQIIFNQIAITDINFFQGDSFGTGSHKQSLSGGANNPIKVIRESIAKWYYALRIIAIIILLVILIYVGIRMALSTIADDKAKYKKWLWNWVVSMCILFVLHYLIIAVINLNNGFVEILYNARTNALNEDKTSFYNYVSGLAVSSLTSSLSGIKAWSYAITYTGIVAFTFIFLIMYIKRMITVAFLILISPIITITYSVDKLKDGESQALNQWVRNFLESVLIQPFHCIIYTVFVATALTSVIKLGTVASGFFTILCLWFTLKAERIIKDIFGFDKETAGDSMVTGAALYGAMSTIGNRAKGLRNGASSYKSAAKFGNQSANVGNATGAVGGNTQGIASASKASALPSSMAQQNLAAANGGNTVPIYGKNGQVLSQVQQQAQPNNSGIILPGTQQFNNTNAAIRNGSLNIQNSMYQQSGTNVTLGGSPILNVNRNRKPIPSNPFGGQTSIPNTSPNLANGGTQIPLPNTNNNQKKNISKPTTLGGKVWSGAKSVAKFVKDNQVGGIGAAMGIVGATTAVASGASEGEVIATAGASMAVGDYGKDKINSILKNRKIKRGQRELASSYNDFKNANNYSDDDMDRETKRLRGMSPNDQGKITDPNTRRYMNALNNMQNIYNDDNRIENKEDEMAGTLALIRSGNLENFLKS